MLDKFYKQWNRRWNKIRADVSLVLDLSSEHVPSAQQTTGHPSKCPLFPTLTLCRQEVISSLE